MADLSQLQTLIDNASSLAAVADEKENAASTAKNELYYAKEDAKKAWDNVYDLLLELSEDRKNDESFRNSRLGYMLKAELEKAKRGR